MMRKKIALCVLAVSLLAAGCGQADRTALGTDSSSVSDSVLSYPQDAESVAALAMDSNPEAVDSSSAAADKEQGNPNEKPQSWIDVSGMKPDEGTETDSTFGEGFNVVPGEKVETGENSQEVKIGDVVTVHKPDGSFDLVINSIRLTDYRSKGIPADRVVEVSYTYRNTHDYPDLLIGEMSFMMLDSEGGALAAYIFDSTDGTHPQPMPIGSGEESTILIGYVLPEDAGSDVTLIYRSSFEETDSFEFFVKASV